ncbi:hypothetical protein JXB28_02115 [Candidatus Woesearchaeota archaeon]|nr:hypothetical protein [Candidatus Woesearchaeota archaeon]
MPSIIDLPSVVAGLKEDERELFSRFFIVQETIGKLALPKEMKPWAEKSFGSISNVESQKIIRVFNKLTFEMALFNELRAKRPIEAKVDEDALKIVKENVSDHFAKPKASTPMESFGRIKGKYCITASNVAKYDGLHGLVIFKKSNPLEFNEKELQDYFATALKWFEKAHKSNKQANYPFLLWNCLWKAGASIIHGHMQLVLGEGMHYSEAELYNKIRKEYDEKHKESKGDFFQDLFRAHELIGLGLRRKGVLVFFSITPKKDKEITIVSEKLDKNCVRAIHNAALCLVKEMGVNSFNLGVIMPPVDKVEREGNWKGFPVIARIVSRGSLSNKTSDIGGVEMFSGSKVIETDPYRVFEKINAYF